MSTKRSKCRIEVNINDIFDELSYENRRLKQLVEVLIQFKEFCESVVSQLDSNDIQRYQQLKEKLNEFKESEINVLMHRPKTKHVVEDKNQIVKKRGKYKRISNDMRLLIIKMLDSGSKVNEVCAMFDLDRSTVKAMYYKYQRTGIAYNMRYGDPRDKVFTKEQEEVIRQWYKEDPSLTLNDLQENCLREWPNIENVTTDAIRNCFFGINSSHNASDINQDNAVESLMAVETLLGNVAEAQEQTESADEDTVDQSDNEADQRIVKEELVEQLSDEEVLDSSQTISDKEDNSETNDANEREDNWELNDNMTQKPRRKYAPSLSNEMRELVVKMLDNGTKVAEVSKIFGRNSSTIKAIYKKYKKSGCVQKRYQKCKMRALSEEQVKILQQWFKEDPSLTLKELKNRALEKWPDIKEPSDMTIGRCLKETLQSVKRVRKLKNMSEELSHSCPLCGKEFSKKSLVAKHMEIHNETHPYSCDQCPFTTKTKNCLRNHVDAMHGPNATDRPFKCLFEGCGKDFRCNGNLKTHIASFHAPLETVVCIVEGCGRVLKNKRLLKVHLQVFHGEAKFGCEWPGCDYKAKSLSTLKNHRLVHTSERKFVCQWTQCGKQFKTKSHLKDHQRIHTNERKYLCQWPGCNYSCVFGGNLNKHMRVHQK